MLYDRYDTITIKSVQVSVNGIINLTRLSTCLVSWDEYIINGILACCCHSAHHWYHIALAYLIAINIQHSGNKRCQVKRTLTCRIEKNNTNTFAVPFLYTMGHLSKFKTVPNHPYTVGVVAVHALLTQGVRTLTAWLKMQLSTNIFRKMSQPYQIVTYVSYAMNRAVIRWSILLKIGKCISVMPWEIINKYPVWMWIRLLRARNFVFTILLVT